MIIKNGSLVLEAHKEILETIDKIQERVQKRIGAIYKGADLVWLTIYNTIKSCFGSGTWLGEKLWLGDDLWKNN